MKNTIKPQINNVALIVSRFQPLHNGHINLILKAMVENDIVIIGLGSRNQEKSYNNPFSVKQRMNMLKKVFGDSSKLKIIPIADIEAQSKKEWVDYVYDEINKMNLPQPNRYYAGDKINSGWYEKETNKYTNKKPEIILLDRFESKIMSGTMIRQSISNEDSEWKKYVPICIQNYIKEEYPKEFLQKEIMKEKKVIKF